MPPDGPQRVLLSDATKVNLRKDEIESQFASLVSVMPEKLLDELSLSEIADLFAFLEVDATKLPALPVTELPKPMKMTPNIDVGIKPAQDPGNRPEKIAAPMRVK